MSATCPTCFRTFRSLRGMRIHHKKVHGIPLIRGRGKDGILGIVGKEKINTKQNFRSELSFPDGAKRQINLGNVVTFGKTSEQFTHLQSAVNEVSKSATWESHGTVILSAGIYFTPELQLLNYVDLVSPWGFAYLYTDAGSYTIKIPAVAISANSFFQVYTIRIEVESSSASLNFERCLLAAVEIYLPPPPDLPVITFGGIIASAGCGMSLKIADSTISGSISNIDMLIDLQSSNSYFDGVITSNAGGLKVTANNSRFKTTLISYDGCQIYLDRCSLRGYWGTACISVQPGATNEIRITKCLMCHSMNTVERIGAAGTLDIWSSYCELETGFGIGVTEHILVPQNNLDPGFLTHCQRLMP